MALKRHKTYGALGASVAVKLASLRFEPSPLLRTVLARDKNWVRLLRCCCCFLSLGAADADWSGRELMVVAEQ